MQVRFLIPFFTRAAIQFSGIPHNPNPPSIITAPSLMSLMASAAEATTLFIVVISLFQWSRAGNTTGLRRGIHAGSFPGGLHGQRIEYHFANIRSAQVKVEAPQKFL